MKKLSPFLLSYILFACSVSAYGQTRTSQNTESSATYAIYMVHLDNEVYAYEERFLSGGLRTKGTIKSEKKRIKLGYWITYYENGHIDQEGEYVKNKRHGIWKWYFESGKLAAVETYETGKRISAIYYDEEGTEASEETAETQALPAGGMEKFRQFVQQHARYQLALAEKENDAQFSILMTIDQHGKIRHVVCASKKVDSRLSEEAIRLVHLLPDWQPGKEHNRFTQTSVTLPFIALAKP